MPIIYIGIYDKDISFFVIISIIGLSNIIQSMVVTVSDMIIYIFQIST